MKVLFIEPCFENYGGYHRAFGMANALSKKNVKVDLLISSAKKFSFVIEKEYINENLTIYKLPRIYINFFVTGRIPRGLIASAFVLFRNYDLIHIFALIQFESNIPFVISKIFNKKVVIDWDDYWTDAYVYQPIYNKFKIKNYLKWCEYTLQKKAKYATATSDFLIDELKNIGIKKNLKIINGVNLEQFIICDRITAREKLNIDNNEKILLTFGNTFFKERTEYLLDCFKNIFEKDSSVKLYTNQSFKQLVISQDLNIDLDHKMFENIINVGFLNTVKLSDYIGACNALIFFMGETTLEKACFPTRIGTFLNGERVIITNKTDTEAFRVLKGSGSVIFGTDLKDISSKTVAFLQNEANEKQYNENLKNAKYKFSWEAITDHLIGFYKEVLSDK